MNFRISIYLISLFVVIGFSSCTQTVYLPSAAYQPCVDETTRFDAQAGLTLPRGGVYGRAAFALHSSFFLQGSFTYHTNGKLISGGATFQQHIGLLPQEWGTMKILFHAGYSGQTFQGNIHQYFLDRGQKVSEQEFFPEDGARIFEQRAACNWNGFVLQPGLQFCPPDDDLVFDFGLRATCCYTKRFDFFTRTTEYTQEDQQSPILVSENTTALAQPPGQVWLVEPYFSVTSEASELIYMKLQVQYRSKTDGWPWVHMGRYGVTIPFYFDMSIGFHI